MSQLRRFFLKLGIVLRRGSFRSELDEEMAFHREQAEKEYVAEGMRREDARGAVARQFGNTTRLREQSQEAVALLHGVIPCFLNSFLKMRSARKTRSLTAATEIPSAAAICLCGRPSTMASAAAADNLAGNRRKA